MGMKEFNLMLYKEFHELWKNEPSGQFRGDEFLRENGFKSANYNRLEKWWEMDSEDYFLFYFFWGNNESN